MSLAEWITPDWPAPRRVRAFVTTRAGGVSEGEYASMNLGVSSGDEPDRVARNRAAVRAHLPGDPLYLAQVHGTGLINWGTTPINLTPKADASITATPGRVCVVLTADCMPVLLATVTGDKVGVAHAGWRGMAAGVIENAVAAMQAEPGDVVAWMGPTIGPDAFEVGPEVREAFVSQDTGADVAFRSHRPGKYMADLYALARRRLMNAGVKQVHGGGFCTYHEADRFFSYRRAQKSGRMGAFIWIHP
jgi:YfiH family protein